MVVEARVAVAREVAGRAAAIVRLGELGGDGVGYARTALGGRGRAAPCGCAVDEPEERWTYGTAVDSAASPAAPAAGGRGAVSADRALGRAWGAAVWAARERLWCGLGGQRCARACAVVWFELLCEGTCQSEMFEPQGPDYSSQVAVPVELVGGELRGKERLER